MTEKVSEFEKARHKYEENPSRVYELTQMSTRLEAGSWREGSY